MPEHLADSSIDFAGRPFAEYFILIEVFNPRVVVPAHVAQDVLLLL